ncbi:hypothetical protein [Mycobacteroides abscessus]|uniref:hypothetical protein n=1 Tax=Mycobacteroides abscessus TaxID=36809 RepID=UPI00036DCA5A|nr:hypothetical protein [Mycobacteroides abscessus]
MAEGLIPFSRVIERVRKLASDEPDRIGASQYFNDEDACPEDIFGIVLEELGATFEPDDMGGNIWGKRRENGTYPFIGRSNRWPQDLHWEELGVSEPTEDESAWVKAVAWEQDEIAWGFAVGSVDEDFKRRGITV